MKIKKKMKKLKKMLPLRGKKTAVRKIISTYSLTLPPSLPSQPTNGSEELRRRSDAFTSGCPVILPNEGPNNEREFDLEDEEELEVCKL